MEELIHASPKTLDDIKRISGFGDIVCQKYGKAILKIFSFPAYCIDNVLLK